MIRAVMNIIGLKPGETVLDPMAGSGTTGIAAIELGWKCVLIEQSEKYCKIARQRIVEARMQGRMSYPEETCAEQMTIEGSA